MYFQIIINFLFFDSLEDGKVGIDDDDDDDFGVEGDDNFCLGDDAPEPVEPMGMVYKTK